MKHTQNNAKNVNLVTLFPKMYAKIPVKDASKLDLKMDCVVNVSRDIFYQAIGASNKNIKIVDVTY